MYNYAYNAYGPAQMDPNLALAFTENNWSAMSPAQRLQALQRLENHFAQSFGRPALEIREIPPQQSQAGLMGFYKHNERRMYIHPRFLQNPNLALTNYSASDAVLTVLHEGRHGFQFHASANGSSRVPRSQLTEWAMNHCRYFGYSSGSSESAMALYYFQPVEMDARRFARENVEEFARRIAVLTGRCDNVFRRTLDTDRRNEAYVLSLGRRALSPELLNRADAEARAAFLHYNPDACVGGVKLFHEARRQLFPDAAFRSGAMGFNLPPQWDDCAASFAPEPLGGCGFPATFAMQF